MEWWPYLCWSFGVAGAVFAATAWPGLVLSDRHRDGVAVSLHLRDDEGWVDGFLRGFDRVFGAKALSWSRLWRSALASTLGVAALWVLFGPVLGMMDARADSPLPLAKAVLFGLAVNVAADWLSLIETRWLLARFAHWRSLPAQLGLLVLDVVFSGAVIVIAVNAFRWIEGAPLLHPVEMMAGYSAWAIFFYSTFLTSVWAWAYALGMIAVRVFSAAPVYALFNHKRPFNSLATLAAVATLALLVGGEAARRYVLPNDVDLWLCDTFGGVMCTHGARVTQDANAAATMWRLACLTGDPLQCRRAYQSFGEERRDRAAQLLETACQQAEDMSACTTVGFFYSEGVGVPQDADRARALYDRACNGGEMLGCANLGVSYEQGFGVTSDLDRARALYDRACTGGEMMGCSNLGVLYGLGLGVAQDRARERELYGHACDGGEMMGCANLGFLCHQGLGMKQDLDRARALFGRACDGGEMMSCSNLGTLFEEGLGVTPDPVRARTLYDRACRGGDMLGCVNLGALYGQGLGAPQDLDHARRLYDQGCTGGEMLGCANLGVLFEHGRGVSPNVNLARDYYDRACTGGITDACTWRDALPPDPTPPPRPSPAPLAPQLGVMAR